MSISSQRLNERLTQLSKIGKTENGGVTRLSLTPEYKEAEALIAQWMKDAGLTVHIDAVGNMIGRKEGKQHGAPSIIIGSHIDTVINGGQYDGTAGSWAGLKSYSPCRKTG